MERYVVEMKMVLMKVGQNGDLVLQPQLICY